MRDLREQSTGETASDLVMPQARGPLHRNADIAAGLEEIAALLERQQASVYRVQAYRRAAETLRTLDQPVATLLRDEGMEGLDALPFIGPATARAIRDLVTTGHHGMLDRLRGSADPVAVLASVPGIGPVLAHRLHDEADIETLEQLELAAHDGRLARIPGFGAKRVAGVRDALATRLGRPRHRPRAPTPIAPSVGELLDVDREYRAAVEAGTLPKIAPRRFNRGRVPWLPVLHTMRDERHYTALFSNTALAHRRQRTNDWVVIYVDGADGELQHTVVTETSGPLLGQRVVRGRESECQAFYGTVTCRASTPRRVWKGTDRQPSAHA